MDTKVYRFRYIGGYSVRLYNPLSDGTVELSRDVIYETTDFRDAKRLQSSRDFEEVIDDVTSIKTNSTTPTVVPPDTKENKSVDTPVVNKDDKVDSK